MPLIAIPNISTAGGEELKRAVGAVESAGGRVLDVHSDERHNRSVLTCSAPVRELETAMVSLAEACLLIDLTRHRGIHPRIGVLDVCPFVPHGTTMEEAVAVARRTAIRIGDEVGLPVYLYGRAAARAETRELPDLRQGGLEQLIARAANDLPPDAGPAAIDPRRGVVCVGARGPLIAFNVWLTGSLRDARTIASEVREPGVVRALGLQLEGHRVQVSMNLLEPERRGIDDVFEEVVTRANALAMEVVATEIVGLPRERFMPDPNAETARLLIEPGRSLESVLAD